MKQFFKWLGKHIAGAMVFSLFSILFIAGIVYALSYPSAPPSGEVVGGKFMQYFNSIQVPCPIGQYLNGYDVNFHRTCLTAPTGPQGPTGANGTTGPQGAIGPTGAASTVQGPTGPTGATGPAGVNGTNGTNGANGLPGATGANGLPGANGTNGTNGTNGITIAAGSRMGTCPGGTPFWPALTCSSGGGGNTTIYRVSTCVSGWSPNTVLGYCTKN